MDEAVLSEARVELLLPCLPTADDVEAIMHYDGDPELLAKVRRASPPPSPPPSVAPRHPTPLWPPNILLPPLRPSPPPHPPAKVERFFLAVHDVPLFSSRVHALRAKQTFAAQAAHAQRLLETLGRSCGAVLLASGFESLLGLVHLYGAVSLRGLVHLYGAVTACSRGCNPMQQGL